jgi:ABC-2 type transport system ATP-binding protein
VTATAPMIAAAGLRMVFGRTVALHGLDLDIAPGELFALIGPDGAGKTTFFRLVAGLARPTAGRLTRGPLRTFGFVPQRFGLYEDLSVDENLALRSELYGLPRGVARARAADLLARVGLDRFGARLAGALSGGMKQKLSLVAALITEPELLLLDEPTTGVDPVSRREFWAVLNQLHHGGMTILVSTPYMDEAEYATRIGFLDEGQLVAVGTADELVATYPRALVAIASTDRVAVEGRVRGVAGVDDVSLFGTRLHVRGIEGVGAQALVDALRGALTGLVAPEAIGAAAPSLEDVFVLEGERRLGREA